MKIPSHVSGRPVTNRGVHLVPFGYHSGWAAAGKREYWQELFRRCHLSWAVLINEGDSVLEDIDGMTPLEILLDAGVIPLIRDKQLFPSKVTCHATAERTVSVYARYGLKPFWILYNEPFDRREWRDKKVPPKSEAWPIIADCWMSGASELAAMGCYVGFPDGPCYNENPFEWIKAARWLWDGGHAFYAAHTYGKGRPVNYPYDPVTQQGYPLTEGEYRAALDDYADDRAWYDLPLGTINQARREWAQPGLTAIQDDTCWRGWEKIAWWAEQTLGYVPPMAMTEGGWCPRDRAGTGMALKLPWYKRLLARLPSWCFRAETRLFTGLRVAQTEGRLAASGIDIRWPYTTPRMVAAKTLAMYEHHDSPYFAACPWLLGDDSMVNGGYVGWPYDAWTGWAYSDIYGFEKPVIGMLEDNPPPLPLELTGEKLQQILRLLAQAQQILA